MSGQRTEHNVALYVGSALITAAAFFFAGSTNEALIAPTLITTTLIFYVLGLVLYRKVDYLKPVGKAFAYTGLTMTLAWFYAFQKMGMSDSAAFLSCSAVFTALCYVNTILFAERALGVVSYLASYISFYALSRQLGGNTDLQVYIFALLSAVFSLVIAVPWYLRATWLPVPFRVATRSFARIAMPLVCCFSFLAAYPNAQYPFLAVIVACIAITQYAFGFYLDHSANKILALRALIQALIFFIAYDIAGVANLGSKTTAFVLGITLFTTSALQLAYSLFAKRSRYAIQAYESVFTALAVCSLLFSMTFFTGLTDAQQSILRLTSYGVTSIFGIGLYLKHSHAGWLVLPMLMVLLVPPEVGLNLMPGDWNVWTYIIAYTTISCLFTALYAVMRNGRGDERDIFTVCFGSTLASLLAVLVLCLSEQQSILGWLIVTVPCTIQIVISQRFRYLEFPIYTAAFCLYSLSNELFGIAMDHHVVFGPSGEALDLVRSMVGVHILAAAPLAVGLWKERGPRTSMPRIGFAYFLISSVGFIDAAIYRGAFSGIGLTVVFLIEQICFMIAGVTMKRNWLIAGSSAFTLLAALSLSIGHGYLWLFIIGLALIVGVILELSKAHRKEELATQTNSKPVPEDNAPSKKANRLGGKPHESKYE